MTEKNQQNDSPSRRKWPWIVLASILGLVIIVRLALLTGPVHRWVKQIIVSQANKNLQPTLSIGHLSGDLWDDVTLTNIQLRQDTTVASIDTLHLRYRLLSYFSDQFDIPEISIKQPFVKLVQQQDSTFNAQHWLKSDTTTTTDSSSFAVSIGNLRIRRGNIDVSMMQTEPHHIRINQFNLGSSIDYRGQKYTANISNLAFKVDDLGIPSGVKVDSKAHIDEKSFNLQKLAIATVHSAIDASGKVNLPDTTGHFSAHASPLGWQDVAAFTDSLPMHQAINLSLGVKATRQQIQLSFDAHAPGINQLQMRGQINRGASSFMLTSATLTARQLNLDTFMGDTTMPRLQDVRVQANGRMPIANYQKGSLKGTLSAKNIRQASYQLDKLQGSFSLTPQRAHLRLEPQQQGEKIIAEATIARPWANHPEIDARLTGQHINPKKWMPEADSSSTGDLNFTGRVNGPGWYPQQKYWNYNLSLQNSLLMGQPIDRVTVSGRFNEQRITNETTAQLAKSALHLQADVQNYSTTPAFSYQLSARKFNVAQLPSLKAYPTSINATAQGQGRGQTLDSLTLQTSLRMDSSLFRGERIDVLNADVQLADSMISIKNGELKSSFADGSASGKANFVNMYNRANTLHFNLHVKDISSFASLVDVKTLQAIGDISGDVSSGRQDSLAFNGKVDLKQVNYNNQFMSQQIDGTVGLQMKKNPAYKADLTIDGPTISSVDFKKLSLQTSGRQRDSTITGDYKINLTGRKKQQMMQAGSYAVHPDSITAAISDFSLQGPKRMFKIAHPYHVRYASGAVQTDTLRLNGSDGQAMIELSVPFADSLRQKGYLKTKGLNLAGLQRIFLDRTYVQGSLFGQASINRTDTSLVASGDVLLSEMKYNGVTLDTLHVGLNVKNKRLDGQLDLRKDGKQIMDGAADIPFDLQQQDKLQKGVLAERINGHLHVRPIALQEFDGWLKQLGMRDTRGQFQFDGELSGEAGHPQLRADLGLQNAQLSGVPVDSLSADLRYSHDQSRMDLRAGLISKGQKMVSVDARVPFKMNLQQFDVSMPGSKENISIDLKAQNFALKMANDFVGRDKFRNIQGMLNGEVHVSGPRNNLQASGNLKLQKAALRVVQAGIRVDHINSTLSFQPDKIAISDFSAESGGGKFSANGSLAMDKLVPGAIDLQAKATSFKIANTDDYNGIIDLDVQASGTATNPTLKGKLNVVSGFVQLSNFGGKSVEDVQLDTAASPQYNISMYDSLNLDMQVQMNKRFVIRNKRYLKMELKLDGDVNLQKKPANDLQMFGTLNTAGGYAEPLGKRFDLQNGSIAFDGPINNPQLDIHTLYEPPQTDQEVKIFYIIQGTVQDPQFKYDSNPKMDLAGIISYTLFGQPYYKLNSTQQGVASTSSKDLAADFAMEVVMNRLESIATQQLGIDVVRIDNTQVGGKTGTSITTGWYLNPKVFFAIQNIITGSSPSTGFYLEYYLQKNLKLILEQGTDNQQGVDLQWNYDY